MALFRLKTASSIIKGTLSLVAIEEVLTRLRAKERILGPVHTNALSKYAFSLSSKTHRLIRVHTTFLIRFRLSILKLHVVTHV